MTSRQWITVNVGLSNTVSEISGEVGRKTQSFLPPTCSLRHLGWGCYPWNNFTPFGLKTLNDVPNRWWKSLTICARVSTQYRNWTEGRTDGRTDKIAISVSRISMLTCNKRTLTVGRREHSSHCSLLLGIVDDQKMSVLMLRPTLQCGAGPVQVDVQHSVAAFHWRYVREPNRTLCVTTQNDIVRLCVFIAFSYSLVTIMLVCRENIRTSLYNTSQDATWGIWWWSRVLLFSYSVGFDYRAARTHKFVNIPTRPRKRSVTIQCWIRQSTFNEYISLVILECRNRYITLRCRGNGNRKKLLTDSVMSLKAQQ